VKDTVRTCPVCGAGIPKSANFCPSCGRPLTGDVDPVSYDKVSDPGPPPKLFGVVSPAAAFVLGCVLLLGALAALVSESPILAIVLFAASGAAFVLFYGAAERDSAGALAHGALTARDRVRGWARFTTSSAGAWTKAGRAIVRLRRELRALRRDRDQVQRALGEAAFKEDEEQIASLRARMREIDQEIAAREQKSMEAVAHARTRVEDERVAVHPTEVLTPDDEQDGN
jgi:zinc ribbon protein